MTITSHVITCKAAICWGVGKPLTVEEIQIDPPKATEVRVKMLCASVCHTDISSTQGFPHANFPIALGHEGVGVVESVGDQVKNLKQGDVVIPTYIDNTSRMSIRGQRLHHVLSCATWSEYMVIDSNYILKVDSRIDPAHASFISCGFSTGFGAAWREAKVKSGSSVAVFGLGAVGLGAVSGAKMQGATKIIGIDKNEMKREKGEAFGITDYINPADSDKSVSELVKELSGGMGVDYSFECTGVAPLLTESLEATKMGKGKTIAIGTGTEPIVPLGLASIMYGRTLKGSVFGGLKAISDLSITANKCQKEEFPLQELLTHEVALADINKAFELLKQRNCVKVVIKISY
ncbi:alcohol dehydrogenase-like 2 isoform X2 [Abrus precatorius]|uniref:Alcohol dehydrogenase-like 2 isoform X2 n=1 Tax=Abrus precatorius TaxID=3816 RepID=A0A8B8LM28_ABRPR|nr:alcohol dehydrogenase-like 2 isoform X2 [Abrus precatorius]